MGLSEFVLSEDLFKEFKNKIERELISEFVEILKKADYKKYPNSYLKQQIKEYEADAKMSETDFYCPDCSFILTETSHLIDKLGGFAYFVCGKCSSEFTMKFAFKKEPILKSKKNLF